MRNWSLPRKIVALGLVNLSVIALVLLVFARIQFGVGPESLVAGAAAGHILGIANAFRLELDSTPDKDAVIASYASRYDAAVFLTNPEGHAMYGPEIDVPADVLRRMQPGPRPGGPPPDDDRPPPPRRRGGPPPGGEPFFLVTTANPALYWAVVRLPVVTPDGSTRPAMLIFRAASIWNSKLFFDWRPWLGLAAALLAVSLLCWLPFLRGLTHSIREMDQVTRDIALGHFDTRVPEARRDELGDLGQQINIMATRLQNFVSSQKRFLGDAAHELSAPLARIQFALGILERRVEESRRADIDVLRDEIQEMSVLVNELLSFSKAGLNSVAAPLERVDLADLVRRAAARESVTPEIAVEENLWAMARPGQLLRAVGNLLRNAARYAGEHGPIEVSARGEGKAGVVITVADHGPGLPEDALEQVFEPFWRPESSRNRDTGGVGLGLAIVKSCVESCGGTVSCRNRQPSGLAVTIRLAAAVGAHEKSGARE